MEIINKWEELDEEELRSRLEGAELPAHVAVIMDGNGRWAQGRGFARVRGHQAGVKAVRESVTACREVGVKYLTLYAFSSENWDRPKLEVQALMKLLKNYLVGERDELIDKEIRFQAIGHLERLPADVRAELDETRALTEAFDKMTLTLALGYGGRAEIVDAARRLAANGAREIDEDAISRHLYAPDHPDPDLLIRTSGEVRVSNFLLWEIAYAEIYVTNVLWPDFRAKHMYAALVDYLERDRRYGRVSAGEARGA
ncbi:MAG: polyprenyl diphosphate synthase [Candidatus Zixiibacteriota bacterium]|jgi:undecaprenyl diphosphate synthase